MSTRTFAPVQPLRPAWQIALLAGVSGLLVAVSGVAILGMNEHDSFTWRTWFLLGVSFAMAFSGCSWAAAQWMSPSRRADFWRPLLGLLVAIAGLVIGSQAEMFSPTMAGMCLTIGSVFSLVSSLILFAVFRRTAPLMRQRVAVACGVLSGFVGFLAIQLHCPINELWHMIFGHALLPIVWGVIGYWTARLAFR